jgi:hypothetical protein
VRIGTGPGSWCLDELLRKNYGQLDALTALRDIAPIYQTGDAQVCTHAHESTLFESKEHQTLTPLPYLLGADPPPLSIRR